jgi:YD repeat-containing protein
MRSALLCGFSWLLAVAAQAGTTTYTYDVHGRLKTVTSPVGTDQSTTTYGYDNAGNRLSVITQLLDTTPPNAPTALTAAAQAFDRIQLGWTKSVDVGGGPVSLYRVYRGGAVVASPSAVPAPPPTQTYDDQPLAANTPYTYAVSAVDAAGNESQLSPSAGATTPPGADLVAPSIPGGLNGTAISGTWVHLGWTASTDTGGSGLGGYEIFRSQLANSVGSLIGTSLTTSYDDQSATPATQYYYRVRAFDNWTPRNYSENSGQLPIATPDTLKPSAPGTPSFTSVTANAASVNWGDASDNVGVTGYQYRRNQGATIGAWTDVASRPVNLTGLVASTTYTVEARARDAAGNWGDPSGNSFVTQAFYSDSISFVGGAQSMANGLGTLSGYAPASGMGSLSPNSLLYNKTVASYYSYIELSFDGVNWSVVSTYTVLQISGFASTPTADWLQSVSGPGGATYTGASAFFNGCSGSTCTWTWPTNANFQGSSTLTIVHK